MAGLGGSPAYWSDEAWAVKAGHQQHSPILLTFSPGCVEADYVAQNESVGSKQRRLCCSGREARKHSISSTSSWVCRKLQQHYLEKVQRNSGAVGSGKKLQDFGARELQAAVGEQAGTGPRVEEVGGEPSFWCGVGRGGSASGGEIASLESYRPYPEGNARVRTYSSMHDEHDEYKVCMPKPAPLPAAGHSAGTRREVPTPFQGGPRGSCTAARFWDSFCVGRPIGRKGLGFRGPCM